MDSIQKELIKEAQLDFLRKNLELERKLFDSLVVHEASKEEISTQILCINATLK